MDINYALTNDSSSLIIGPDLQEVSQRSCLKPEHSITVKRPHDVFSRKLPINISSQNRYYTWAHVNVIRLMRTSNSFLVSNQPRKLRIISLAKRLHRYLHAPLGEMPEILLRSAKNESDLQKASKTIVDTYLVCARFRLPLISKKLSVSHVCQSFDRKIQADFIFVEIRNLKYFVLHFINTGTKYHECRIVRKRSNKKMTSVTKTIWILRHGAPHRVSAGSEFSKNVMKKFLFSHKTFLAERPVCRHNKTIIVEWKR